MPVTFEIVEEGHVVFYTFADPWSLNELDAFFETERAHRDNVPFKVHTLGNMERARSLPSGILGMRHRVPSQTHPRHGRLVFIGAHPLIKTIAEASFRLTNFMDGKFFKTADEAWTYLRDLIASETTENG